MEWKGKAGRLPIQLTRAGATLPVEGVADPGWARLIFLPHPPCFDLKLIDGRIIDDQIQPVEGTRLRTYCGGTTASRRSRAC